MFAVETAAGPVRGLTSLRDAEVALWCAVNYVAMHGVDARVRREDEAEPRYRVEADSKVDLADRYYPAIVHKVATRADHAAAWAEAGAAS